MRNIMRFVSDIQKLIEDQFGPAKKYASGTLLFNEDEPLGEIFYLLEGQMKIIRSGPNKEMILWYSEPGEFIGISSLFDNSQVHSSTAEVIGSSASLVKLDKKAFLNLLETHSDIQKDITKRLCRKIKLTEMRIFSSSHQSIRARLIDTLIFLAQQNHNESIKKSNKTMIVKCTEKMISDLSGISHKPLNKLLSEFEINNLLRVEESQIIIGDYERFLSAK